MSLQLDEFAELALDLTSGLSDADRFQRLLTTIRDLVACDAAALLKLSDHHFEPLATNGMEAEVLGRRFVIADHPRLEAIARAGDVVRFPADSQLPDPYDGLIANHPSDLKVHACIGLPLLVNQRLIGAVTIDGFNPNQFDGFSDRELRAVTALAAASLNNALLVEELELLSAGGGERVGRPQSAPPGEIIGQSAAMLDLKREIGIVSSTDLTALVTGETGVGKELVAEAIHAQSPRAAQPLVYLNCAALPESVAESELFGHVKGAFTGAISHRQGKFEMADGGTLFLDEIGELPLSLQAKLLRVLQYGDLQRVGSDQPVQVDVRIIAATNRDLKQEVSDGRFRADLYHRLSVFPLWVPPLRSRGQDVLLLCGFFLERNRSKLGLAGLSLTDAAQESVRSYTWPGNVRELEHCLFRAAVVARSAQSGDHIVIEPAMLRLGQASASPQPEAMQQQVTEAGGLRDATDQFQTRLIQQALTAEAGNWSAAARRLQMDSGNLHRLARRLGLKK
ncbi:nitric oxide reductase transcriptional regulator NorR [Ferrimonas kyonanensis]|uniref:nitric oxide reductase transcriptional regulator NorR n=1 Tax=Ferrimonas kyonanensis TaxID=364763 RepID=UPI000405D876|nr:nitric oxide reductase transcriptional regulator NorR [Ferrimonas kyonanensis]